MAEAKDVVTVLRTWSALPSVKKARCVPVFFLFATLCTSTTAAQAVVPAPGAQTTPGPAVAAGSPTNTPNVSYAGGQLTIHAANATLADVLAKIAALTGVKIDVPEGSSGERMPIVQLGPGPARQILTSLLSDSNFDYVIQASEKDPEKLQSVMVMARDKKDSAAAVTEAAERPSHSPYIRMEAQHGETDVAQAPETSIPRQAEQAALDANASNPEIPSPQSDQSAVLKPVQRDQWDASRPGALTPPQTMSSQAINQQLQQMYQQRMQIVQQGRQANSPPPPQ